MKINFLPCSFIKNNNDKIDQNYNLRVFTVEFQATVILKEWDMVSCLFTTGFVITAQIETLTAQIETLTLAFTYFTLII